MKKILSIAFFVAACVFTSQAQEKTEQPKHKSKAKKEWRKSHRSDLNLTADQQKEMKSINTEFRTQAKAIKANQSLTEQQRKDQVKALHSKRKEKVKAILTPEQQQKIAQHKKPRKKQHNRDTTTK